MNRKDRKLALILLTGLLTAAVTGCGNAPRNSVVMGDSELSAPYDESSDPCGSEDKTLFNPEEEQSLSAEENPTDSEENPTDSEEEPADAEEEPTDSEEEPTDAEENPLVTAADKDAIKSELRAAIIGLRQPAVMDISEAGLSDRPDLDVKNLYYDILKESPELKYAYEITVDTNDPILVCSFRYMPYKTGVFPDGFAGGDVETLQDIIDAAGLYAGEKPYDIAIREPSLEPDVINRALQQVGGGYINCTLNSDATQIVFSAPLGMTVGECLEALAETDRLADGVISRLIEDGMTDREKAATLYSYITENVSYDRLYYSDRTKMPYDSQTAFGALKKGTAICGGYSHAIKLLFEKAGIPCYHVSGKHSGEPHMWNMALLDGQWLWFDATADRGFRTEADFRHFALNELNTEQYSWNSSFLWFAD